MRASCAKMLSTALRARRAKVLDHPPADARTKPPRSPRMASLISVCRFGHMGVGLCPHRHHPIIHFLETRPSAAVSGRVTSKMNAATRPERRGICEHEDQNPR